MKDFKTQNQGFVDDFSNYLQFEKTIPRKQLKATNLI